MVRMEPSLTGSPSRPPVLVAASEAPGPPAQAARASTSAVEAAPPARALTGVLRLMGLSLLVIGRGSVGRPEPAVRRCRPGWTGTGWHAGVCAPGGRGR